MTQDYPENKTDKDKIECATSLILNYSSYDGDHHKQWVFDQVLRILWGEEYEKNIASYNEDIREYGDYRWDEGIAP